MGFDGGVMEGGGGVSLPVRDNEREKNVANFNQIGTESSVSLDSAQGV